MSTRRLIPLAMRSQALFQSASLGLNVDRFTVTPLDSIAAYFNDASRARQVEKADVRKKHHITKWMPSQRFYREIE